MKTLIELYDERPLDNVLATEMFHPEETIYICPPEVAQNKALRSSLSRYFELRGCPVKLTFVPVSLLDAVKVERQLRQVLDTHEDCTIDISGGTDAALFAAGAVSAEVPVITYSRKNGSFYEIRNAPFARSLACPICLDARACLMMAGGELYQGREDLKVLKRNLDLIPPLFKVYSEYRRIWNEQIAYIQKISRADDPMLSAAGLREGRASNHRVTIEPGLFEALARHGLIQDLKLDPENISFRFVNNMVRFWLRDMGSVLELHVYRSCLKSGLFDDCILSAVINWRNSEPKAKAVTNEIDVMCVQGVTPLFISCKTCEIRTEALNELAILRDRFGGKGSHAAIVTSASASRNRRIMLKRAADLDIRVIEWEDLESEQLCKKLIGE